MTIDISFWNRKKTDFKKIKMKLWYGKFVQLYYFLLKSLPEFNANLISLGTYTNAYTLAHTCAYTHTHTQLMKSFSVVAFKKIG